MIEKYIKDGIMKDRRSRLSLGDLARKYDLPKSTIQYIVNNYGKQKKKTGPKDKLLKHDKRRIKQLINLNLR